MHHLLHVCDVHLSPRITLNIDVTFFRLTVSVDYVNFLNLQELGMI